MTDNVNNPKHYAGSTSLECIECMRVTFGEEAVYHFCLCNAFKCLWRYKNKNGAEDIDKARRYLNYVQHDIERDGDNVPEEIHLMYGRLNDLYIDIKDNYDEYKGDQIKAQVQSAVMNRVAELGLSL